MKRIWMNAFKIIFILIFKKTYLLLLVAIFTINRKENELEKYTRRECVRRKIVKHSHFVERRLSLYESVIISYNYWMS